MKWNAFILLHSIADVTGNGTLDRFGVVGYTWSDAFDSNGVQLFDRRGTECYLTGEEVREAISFMEKLNGLHDGYSVGSKDFDLGNVAFQPMLFSEYRAYKPYPLSIKKYSGFEWECIPMPAGNHGANVSEVDKAVRDIMEGSSNISMELIIWNREINQFLKNQINR